MKNYSIRLKNRRKFKVKDTIIKARTAMDEG
jgi:hypothetical protein